MNNSKVYVESCHSYNEEKIEQIIRESFDFINFTVPENKVILFKPNVLGAYSPKQHVTTNPVIIKVLINIFLEKDNQIIIGDSSGIRLFGGTAKALVVCGIKKFESKNVEVYSFDEKRSDKYHNKENKVLKDANLTGFLKEVDFMVNIPKLKSHQLTRYTGAVKNLFGLIPGGIKQQYHAFASDPKTFAELLIDNYVFAKDKIILNIMDGIVGIDKNGPGPAGTIKKTGIIAVSKDALAMDFVCSEFIGENPLKIWTNKKGKERGLLKGEIITNKKLEPVKYHLPTPPPFTGFLYKKFSKFACYKTKANDSCRLCAECIRVCPAKAVKLKNQKIVIDYDKCIYCYCCHENCPHKAMDLKDNLFIRIYKKFSK